MGTITARAFGLTFLSSLMIQAIAVFTGIIAARLLSADGRGELAAIILWPSIFATLGLLGTPWAITREAAQEDRTAHLLVNSVILSLILSLGTVGLGYFAVPWLLPREKQHILELVRFFLLFIPPSILNYNLMALDQGWLKWERFNLLRISYFVCYLLFLIYFWLVGIRTVKWFVVAMLVSQLVPVTLRLACQRQHLKQGRPQPREMGRLVAKGLPFFLASISNILSQQFDKALVVSMLSMDLVGCYIAAFSFATVHESIGITLGVTSLAAMANIQDQGQQGAYLCQVFRQATLLYLGAGLGVACLTPWLIVPLFGRSFGPAVKPAMVLALATSLFSLANILNQGLRGAGKAHPGIMGQLLGAGILAIAALLMVPPWGIVGMAGATVFGAGGQLLFLMMATAYSFKLPVRSLWGIRLEEVKLLRERLRSALTTFRGTC